MQKKRTTKTVAQQALELHKKLKGKTTVSVKTKVTKNSYQLLYTPGVAAVSSHLATHPEETNLYTGRGKNVAVVSDGSAVLGLGNIGPEGALPVMEGKALLFKEFGGVDAVPLVLGTQNTEEIIQTIQAIAPSFGGINLEDIAAPKCFEIEKRLKEELSIPVMHDDQHGTAIVVLAGLINAHKVVKKNIAHSRIAVIGAGSAGVAIAKILILYGVGDVVVVDSTGIVSTLRTNITGEKVFLANNSNNENRTGGILEALVGADVVVGVSKAGVIRGEYVRMMAQRPIVFALANPEPEIMPEDALAAGAAVVATGRPDYPNQINNVLAFPGVFKGALENGVQQITDEMKIRAAQALAKLVPKPTAKKIIPSVFDRKVAVAVAKVIR
jgi:malate dehydrogenase (oxaloacetate-decarboxylating)